MRLLFPVIDIDIEHISIMLLSALLKQYGCFVKVIGADHARVCRELNKGSYDVLAYSSPTVFFNEYLQLNRQVKEKYDIFTLFGGAHPTFVPEIIQDKSIDCVCRGEGEYAILELIKALSEKTNIRNIANLYVKEDGIIYRNPPRPLIEDLDTLPFPDRDLFPDNETYCKGKMHVITGRGCPYSCSYCSHPAYSRLYGHRANVIRRRSPENVIDEICRMKEKTDIRLVMFEDDLFISSREWLDEFTSLYSLEVGIPFFCYVRADLIAEENVKLLKKAGCIAMSMGLETADDRLRNDILKRGMSRESIVKAAGCIKREGIRLEMTNIIGIPTGSLADDFKTLQMNVDLRPGYSSVKLLMPYPQTEIHKFSEDNNMLDDNIDHLEPGKTPFLFESVNEKRAVENLRKLFALTVEWPFILPIVKKLIYLPLEKLYSCFFIVWEGYTSYFRLYPTGHKGFVYGIKKYWHRVLRKNTL
ncbi:MAG: radical SAM protein [Elusimicrobiota bacterium]